jgi:fibronectin type 3 domain-containing protein
MSTQRQWGYAAAMIAIAILLSACTSTPAKSKPSLNSGHSVTLHWQASAGTKYYCVYRSTKSGAGYQKIGTSPVPNYKDSSVPSGAVFYYVVTAVGDKGESKFSSEIKAVVP